MRKDVLIVVAGTELDDVNTEVVTGTLEDYQKIVGGYIENVCLPGLIEKDIILVANEEGLLKGLPLNENLNPFVIVGQVFFVGRGEEDYVSLTAEQLHYVTEWLEGLEAHR